MRHKSGLFDVTNTNRIDQEAKFILGDRVEKVNGYSFDGVVVSVFANTYGDIRYVVECTIEGANGCLHIFNGEQLTLRGA